MTEMGEGIFVPKPPKRPKEEKEDSRKGLKIRLLLFFDGTLNNRTNIAEREANSNLYQRNKDSSSYNNGRSNIALLESNVVKEHKKYDHVVSIYTEGPGTENLESDHLRGYAIGTGSTGIKRKVSNSVNTAVFDIEEVLSEQTGSFTIKELTVDLFGFSRGAAAARHCIHRITDEDEDPIGDRLGDRNIPVESVVINLVGLFDTVSSHGLSFSNDVSSLNLDAIRLARSVIQLEASEEYRAKFSLTNIESAGGKGDRICLPGAHSDVGGGYTVGPETQTVSKGTQRDRNRDYEWFLSRGWYRKDEMTLHGSRNYFGHAIKAHRSSVSNVYSKIPLNIMCESMKKKNIDFESYIEKTTDISNEAEELIELKSLIDSRVSSGECATPDVWDREDALLHIVRNKHLHMSARFGDIGMEPRIVDGRRSRKRYDG